MGGCGALGWGRSDHLVVLAWHAAWVTLLIAWVRAARWAGGGRTASSSSRGMPRHVLLIGPPLPIQRADRRRTGYEGPSEGHAGWGAWVWLGAFPLRAGGLGGDALASLGLAAWGVGVGRRRWVGPPWAVTRAGVRGCWLGAFPLRAGGRGVTPLLRSGWRRRSSRGSSALGRGAVGGHAGLGAWVWLGAFPLRAGGRG